jgi:hypothetical protein
MDLSFVDFTLPDFQIVAILSPRAAAGRIWLAANVRTLMQHDPPGRGWWPPHGV